MISAQTRSAFVARKTGIEPASSAGHAFPDHALAAGLIKSCLNTIAIKLRFEVRDFTEKNSFVAERNRAERRRHKHMPGILRTGTGKRLRPLKGLHRTREGEQRSSESALQQHPGASNLPE